MHSISVVLGFSSGWGVLSKSMNLIIFLFIDQILIITSGAQKSDFLIVLHLNEVLSPSSYGPV